MRAERKRPKQCELFTFMSIVTYGEAQEAQSFGMWSLQVTTLFQCCHRVIYHGSVGDLSTMRRHGWQLPYHPLQIVAVAVFSALAFSFYVFFIPFLGSNVLKFHVVAGFSPLVFAVFTLYVRCAAIDPADDGIRRARQRAAAARKSESSAEILLREAGRQGSSLERMEEEVSRSLQMFQTQGMSSWEIAARKISKLACCPIVILWRCIPGTRLLQSLFVGDKTEPEKYIPEEELLYCSLCEAEIFKCSKHCRACDKCVDGFDHHCRWLNNCIGKKNYKTFVAVMVSSLLMLIMQWSIGIFVLTRCFRDTHEFDQEIVEKLGSSFSRVPFVVVVGLCTFLAMLATLPLTQLLFFHLILIRKGITTYDYIVAIREQDAQDMPGETQMNRSLSSSPASSVGTAVSGGSSIGPLQRAVWCTPPRMFVDVENQPNMKGDMVMQYATTLRGSSLRVPSLVELENGGVSSKPAKDGFSGQQKRPIGLSPWKLARLSSKEATKAATRARENSTILRPVRYIEGTAITETEDSSMEGSAEITTASGGHKVGWRVETSLAIPRDRSLLGNERDRNLFVTTSIPTSLNVVRPSEQGEDAGSQAIVPLQSEARSPFRSRSCNHMTAFPTTTSATQSPDALGSPDVGSGDTHFYHTSNQGRSWLYRATSDGYEASGGESADDTSDQGRRLSQAWSKLKMNPSFISRGEGQNAAIKWRNGLEDVCATWSRAADSRATSTCEERSNGSRVEANILKHVKKDWPGIRDKISTSTEGSNNSSPSHYESPSQRMSPDVQTATDMNYNSRLEKSKSQELGPTFNDPSCGEGSPKANPGKRGLYSAKRLKESILAYKRGLSASSSSTGPALLSGSP